MSFYLPNIKEGHGVYKGRIYIPLILKMKNILCLDLTETGLIHCTSGKVTGYYISVSQLIIQIINCYYIWFIRWWLHQNEKNVIENACLTLISTGNYNVRWKACWICDYDFFFMSKYVMLYIKPLQKKNIIITILYHLRKKYTCLSSAWV